MGRCVGVSTETVVNRFVNYNTVEKWIKDGRFGLKSFVGVSGERVHSDEGL